MLVIDLAAFNCDVEGERLTRALSAIGLAARCFFCQTSLLNPGEYLRFTELHAINPYDLPSAHKVAGCRNCHLRVPFRFEPTRQREKVRTDLASTLFVPERA